MGIRSVSLTTLNILDLILLRSFDANGRFFIGLSDQHQESDFRWLNNAPDGFV